MRVGSKNMLPSFIGELIITNPDDYFQRGLLKVCSEYQKTHNYPPVFVNVGSNL